MVISGVGKTKLYAISPYDITLVVRPRTAARDVSSIPSGVVVPAGVAIVDIHAVVSVWMVMNPVTGVVEGLRGLGEVKLEPKVMVALVEMLKDGDDTKLDDRLVDGETLDGGIKVLHTVEGGPALGRPTLAPPDDIGPEVDVVLIDV